MGEMLLFNSFFFRLSICALVAKIWPDKVVQWCTDGEFLEIFCILYLQHVSYLHHKFALRHTMCGSMVDIQFPTTENRRGKKERRKIEQTTGRKYNDLHYSIGWP